MKTGMQDMTDQNLNKMAKAKKLSVQQRIADAKNEAADLHANPLLWFKNIKKQKTKSKKK